MRIEILQENLSKALNHVVKAVSSRPNIPVLANVLIQTEKGKIKLSATNLEIGINAWIGADIKEEGSITVSAKLLSEFINSIKPGKISLAQNGQTFEVKSVDNNAEFFIIPAEDFPNVPQAEKDPIMIINAFELADSISKTVFASAADDSRPVLTGILFEAKGDAFK
ncbi:MAG TPA: DNA polymerase III subunit beta, partial [Candidatus Dojkabacteria bacterium]